MSEDKEFNEFNENEDRYKVGAKKTLEEYHKLDADDEALKKWKESLGLGGDVLPLEFAGDKRRVVVKKMQLIIEGEPDAITLNLDNESDVKQLAEKKFKIKEKAIYHLRVTFKIQHEIITGLRYVQYIKKAGIAVDKIDDHLGSYPPNTSKQPIYEVDMPESEAPSGFLARGSYTAVSKFIDDDKNTHLSLNWGVEIVKK